ncbi:hypothetical protein AXF42_Ash009055 [Apostasia shenzhenica]|uniref:Uncharacterized protein n=1 Tax=Apostasia shenzhenica TaxID=1088818 RepID=A0A2I0ADD7_9ASPA|nr:hypothetical protein AXF42_Ash009055 [Apostasia shenzhenica]
MGPQSHESKYCSEEGDMFYREIEEWIKLVISEEEDHDERSPLRAMNRDPIHLPQKPFLDPIWRGSSFNDIAETWDVGYRVGRENHASWVRPDAVQPSRSSPMLRRSPEACRRRGTGVFIPKVASVAYRTAAVLRH